MVGPEKRGDRVDEVRLERLLATEALSKDRVEVERREVDGSNFSPGFAGAMRIGGCEGGHEATSVRMALEDQDVGHGVRMRHANVHVTGAAMDVTHA